jgi:quercetin dioxygenase-like cupin family protein
MRADREYELHDGERVRVTVGPEANAGELLEVEAEWDPIEVKPFVHLHPEQDERFEVIEGELSVEVDGVTRVAGPGEAIDVPRGSVHRMWNSGGSMTRARWQVRPALDTEGFFRYVHELRAAGRSGPGGMPTPLGGALVMSAFAREVRVPVPLGFDRPLFAALAPLARLRGCPRHSRTEGDASVAAEPART